MRAFAFIAALLAGCAGHQIRPAQPDDVGAVTAAWTSIGLPYDANGCKQPRVIVARDAREFYELCRLQMCADPVSSTPGCNASSCFADPWAYVVLGTAYDRPGWIRHELMHWLQWCAGLPMDHKDPRVWAHPGGILASVGG